AEEESVILDDRAAYGESVLIPAEDRFLRIVRRRGREQVAGVQSFVAKEFKNRPVKFVRTGFGSQVHHAAVESPELGRRRIDLDLECRDGVDRRTEGHLSRLRLEGRNAVVKKFIDARTAAVDARQRWAGRSRRRGRDAGHERDQRKIVAPVQWQVDDAAVAYD